MIDDSPRGHELRDREFPEPTEEIIIPAIILGGGIAGLSAARKLSEHSIDFILIEMNSEAGGNSRGGKNQVSSYPYGAHYLPLANPQNKDLIEFLVQSDVITGFDEHGKAIYREEFLCADPDERLYMDGLWQEGILPHSTLSETDYEEVNRFVEKMEQYRHMRGSDGLYAFDIPLDFSSGEEELRGLDKITISEWLKKEGFESETIRWYINYCCRDDYGTRSDETSAWAGIHYFASRKSESANAGFDDVLTWPEGNLFLVQKLIGTFGNERVRANSTVFAIASGKRGIEVSVFDSSTGNSVKYMAQRCIDCLPLFVHKSMKGNVSEEVAAACSNLSYAPWMVANMTFSSALDTKRGVPLSWDNVIKDDTSLGYVNACHQQLKAVPGEVVFTYYKALCMSDPQSERRSAANRTNEQWLEEILAELRPVHADVDEKLREVEIKLWGHAMLRPTLGAIWTDRMQRLEQLNKIPHVYFAHSDHSGISIFEEAFSQGTRAALKLIKEL